MYRQFLYNTADVALPPTEYFYETPSEDDTAPVTKETTAPDTEETTETVPQVETTPPATEAPYTETIPETTEATRQQRRRSCSTHNSYPRRTHHGSSCNNRALSKDQQG